LAAETFLMDMNNIPDRYPNLTIEELEIIGYFARGQKYSFSSKNLKLEFSATSIRLIDRQGKLLGISKQISEWQRKVLVSNSSSYTAKIIEVLTESGFVAKQKSSHPDFSEYHFYKVPDGYKLNHTKILQLWKVWWNNKCDSLSQRDATRTERLHQQLHSQKPIFDPLIFSKGSWHQIQDLQPQQEHFLLQMVKGDPIICGEDLVVWVDKFQAPSINPSPQSTSENIPAQSIPLTPSKSSKSNMPTPTQVLQLPIASISPLQMPKKDNVDLNIQNDDDIDLEIYLSTFNTEDTEDVDRIEGIYNIGELLGDTMPESDLLPPPAPESKSTMRLEVKVIDTPKDNLPISESPVGMQPNSAPIVPPPPPKSPKLIANSKAPNPTPVTPSPKVPVPEPSVSNSSIESPSMLQTSEQKRSLKVKAFETLSKYLKEGDRITHTETIKNTQGEVINRKTTEIQRGCPSWAIDLIQSL
jgi:hypothetical protein